MLFEIRSSDPPGFDHAGVLTDDRGHRHITRGPTSFTEIFVVDEGTLYLKSGNRRFAAGKGTILIHPSGAPQEGYATSRGLVRYRWIHCTPAIKGHADEAGLKALRTQLAHPAPLYGAHHPQSPALVVPDCFKPGRFADYLMLAQALCENRPCFAGEKDALLAAFLWRLSADYLMSGSGETAGTGLAERIRNYIDQHAGNLLQRRQISLRSVADVLGYHPDHVNRVFRRVFGESVPSYVRRSKLGHACYFLSMGMKVGAAAAQAGFGNAEHFALSFRKAFGCSPREYRERCHPA